MAVYKWVMQKSMHLGYIRESYGAGTVIEHDDEKRTLNIDGRVFDNVNDLIILKNNEWVVPYSKMALKEAKEESTPVVKDTPTENQEKPTHMKIVKSDADLMNNEIDIKYTKTANKNNEKQVKNGKMEVIRGDETAAERLVRLQSEIPKMPIVQDDSLGTVVGNTPSLNSGTVKPLTAEEHQSIREENENKIVTKEIDVGNPSALAENTPVKTSKKKGRPKGSKNKKQRTIRKAVKS